MTTILLIASVDTEEDNWVPARDGITVENIRELPRVHGLLRRLGLRGTYFTTYQVAIQPWAAEILRDMAEGGDAEIAAHLHPWNTPPLDEPFAPRNWMLNNLPGELQTAKLRTLTATLCHTIGVQPGVFRAGRYALGPETVAALVRCGYGVDSSVTPFVNWEGTDQGPNFVGAPLNAYRLAERGDVCVPDAAGTLLEIPLSAGFSRRPFAVWSAVRRLLEAPPARPFRLAGIAARVGVVKRILLNPELASVADMLTLSRRLIEEGARHLHVTWHSPSLRPGLNSFSATHGAVERLYRTIAAYVEGLASFADIASATVSEAAGRLSAEPVPCPTT